MTRNCDATYYDNVYCEPSVSGLEKAGRDPGQRLRSQLEIFQAR
jgi:hypothetical protein